MLSGEFSWRSVEEFHAGKRSLRCWKTWVHVACIVLMGAWKSSGAAASTPVPELVPRDSLPEFQFIAAANPAELTPASGNPAATEMRNWSVSHGDAGARRYSALDQINRTNVKGLREAWTYRSNDGRGNIQ